MSKKNHFSGRLVLFCLFCISCTGCCTGNDRIMASVEKKFNSVMSLVHIGMDINEASIILKKHGFRVGRKHTPTKDKTYYQVLVPLIEKIPVCATVAEVRGTSSGLKGYAVLKADLDNRIISIEL
ncbi:MAG: hypothetical protein GY749_36065 [Desulfobacteraceae bacterium]|nr:hypothetical protein [Desulfobacteraceae bacterium]